MIAVDASSSFPQFSAILKMFSMHMKGDHAIKLASTRFREKAAKSTFAQVLFHLNSVHHDQDFCLRQLFGFN